MRESLTGISPKEEEIRQVLARQMNPLSVQEITLELGLAKRRKDTVRNYLQRVKDDGYVEEDSREKSYKYNLTDLKPETLEARLEGTYTGPALDHWAKSRGIEILSKPARPPLFIDPLSSQPQDSNKTIMPILVERSLSQETARDNRPDSETQQLSLAIDDSQRGLTGNSIVESLKPDADAEELAMVRRAVKEECERIGYANVAKVRYRVQDKISDPNKVTKLFAQMGKNGDLSAFGADCFKLKDENATSEGHSNASL